MKEVLSLNGKMNKDVNPLYLDSAKGEVLSRKNCRVFSTDGTRQGISVSLKGMQSVDMSDDTGPEYTAIGYVEDKERDRGILFLYGVKGVIESGSIWKYSLSDSTVTPLVEASMDLNFSLDYPIDADILGDYVYFTDNYNPPRKLKITDETFPVTVTETSVQLAVLPPSDKPAVQVASDPDLVVNKLIGKSFQFATMFIYNDYTYSVLSPYSDLVVSSSIFGADDNTFDNNAIGNYVQVTYDLGGDDVRSVKLLAREGNTGSWFIVEEYETSGSGGSRTYDFYNDSARLALTETQAINLYSDVPRLAKTVKAVQNRIGFGNVLKGYDKTTPTVNYNVAYEDVVIAATSDDLSGTFNDGFSSTEYYVEFTIPAHGSLAVNDVIAISLLGVVEEDRGGTPELYFDWAYSWSYMVTQAAIDSGDAQDYIADLFAANIVDQEDSIITVIHEGDPDGVDGSNEGSGVVRLTFINAHDATRSEANSYGGTFTQERPPTGVSTLKGGSYYNVGISFYDDYGRTSGVLSPTKVYVPHAGERTYANAFDRARIAFTVLSGTVGVPSWATKYRFALTESINFSGVYPFVVGNDNLENISEIFLDGKEVIAINMPTNLQYEFAKGDYLQIEVDSGSAITHTIQKEIIGTRTTVQIGASPFEGFWLIVPKGDETMSTYDGQLAYIYRPKAAVEDLIYYESSDTYDISGGVMQTLTGYVGGEDAWYLERTYQWDDDLGGTAEETAVVEDFYISVDSALRAYSKGRATIELDSLGEIRLQDFVWSFNYLDNTKINGVSTFNPINRKQLDEKDGAIQRIELVGDVLKVIQDNKETSMYVGKAQISDASGSLQLVLSNDFIGSVNPYPTEYGSRYPLSIVNYNRNLYYFDGDHGEVIRSSPNGQYPISEYGMKSEFLRLKRLLDDATDSTVLAFYDVRNDEYVITFKIDSETKTYAFKEGFDAWHELDFTDSSGNIPDVYGNIGEQALSFLNEKLWKHEATTSYNTFYGDLKTLSVKGVLNVLPREEKCLRALEMDSNRAMNTIITSPIANTKTVGQKTLLYPATYRNRNGNFTSAVFKNILTATGEDIDLIHSGNDMTGKYFEIEFTDESATELQLRLVTASYTVNK